MGKGQHQMPTREELIRKYNQINKMQQVCHHLANTFLWQSAQTRPLLSLIFSSLFVVGTAGPSQIPAKPEPKLHCAL